MTTYLSPSTQVQTIHTFTILTASPAEPTTGGGGDQSGAQAPRRPF